MMVPRAYLYSSSPPGLRHVDDEKTIPPKNARAYTIRPAVKQEVTRPHTPSSAVPDASSPSVTSPVRIPQGIQSQSRGAQVNTTHPTPAAPLESLLSSTTIPRRKKRKSQKISSIDHVAEFSKLLLEDVADTNSPIAVGSFGNPQFEELFGQPPDKGTTWRSAPDSVQAATPVSLRSMSTESMPSLVVDDDLPERSPCDLSSPPLPLEKYSPDRRPRLLSTSEDCGDDHPLQHVDLIEPLSDTYEDIIILPTPSQSSLTQKRRASSLRSNLTASLRALKLAAQTVSSIATTPPASKPDDFLTRSIFSFAPELTDDKRPPPSDDPPSPALRRYLNPHSTTLESRSPAELQSYNEYTTRSKASKRRGTRTPPHPRPPHTVSIQLQSCLPSAVRSANASSPPIWLCPDGTPTTTQPDFPSWGGPVPNLARQHEPRENAAFLRILVAEMNMRRSGKFDETMESHARVWLPPRKAVDGRTARCGSERWTVYYGE